MAEELGAYCKECGVFGGHRLSCPNYTPRQPVMNCDICKADICNHDIYYEIEGVIYCLKCMNDKRKVAWKGYGL